MAHLPFDSFPRGEKTRTMLAVDGAGIGLPVLSVRGAAEGPTLVVTAGVHGDEYEGVRTIYEIFEETEAASLRGTLLMVPVVNPPAHRAATRTSPADGGNLARVFPGDPEGSVSARIAWTLAHEIIARADLYLDLHSGGIRYRMPGMIGYPSSDPRAAAAADAFGAPVLWSHPTLDPGRTVSFAASRGIPWLYTEARGAGRIHPEDLAMMKRGIGNLMTHLGLWDRPAVPAPAPLRLHGDGNTDMGLAAGRDGMFLAEVAMLDRVASGQRIGRLVDLTGGELEVYHAPCAGIVGLVRELPPVIAGDPLFLFTEEAQ